MITSPLLMVAYGVDASFLTACDQTLSTVLSACNVLTPALMGIALLYTVGRGYLTGNGLAMDWGPILKATWIFFLLFFYQSLIDTLSVGIQGFTELIAPDQSAAAALSKLTSEALTGQAATGTMGQSDVVQQSPGMLEQFSTFFSSFNLTAVLTHLFTGAVVLVIRKIMEFIQQFVLGFLYVSGPIALTLSMVPSFGQLAMKWLQNFIAVQMWGLSFALLDRMYSAYSLSAQHSTSGLLGSMVNAVGPASTDNAKYMIMSVGIIAMYLMVPYLTSLIIGSSAAQSFAGSVVGMAVGAASAAAGVAAGAGGAPGGGVSGAIGRAMSSGGGGGGGAAGDGGGTAEGPAADAGPSASASAGLRAVAMPNSTNQSVRERT